MPATPIHNTPVVDVSWDAGEQEKKLNTPIAGPVGKAMYAWYDPEAPDGNKDGYPDAKDAYRFPHHQVSEAGDPGDAVKNACSNGLARLDGSNIPAADKDAVRRHLQHHLDAAKNADDAADEKNDDEISTEADADDDDKIPTSSLLKELPPVAVSATVAVLPDYLPLVRATALSARRVAAKPKAAARADAGYEKVTTGSPVAVIPLKGVITPRGSLFARLFGIGPSGLEAFRTALRGAIADPEVKAIVLDVDSPGGLIDMVPETAAELRQARGNGTPIVAVANTMAASAAYWIASQADELIVTPSGQVGSIGVFTVHEDYSEMEKRIGIKVTVIAAGRFKAEGLEGPLSSNALKAMQSNVDDLYSMFVADVAAGRKVKPQAVTAGYGEGRCVLAGQAKLLGMVDRVETLEQTIARLGGTPAEAQQDVPDAPDLDEDEDDQDDAPMGAQEAGGSPADRLYGEVGRVKPAWLL